MSLAVEIVIITTSKKEKHATLTVVRWIAYTLGALGARVWDVECRAIRAHQLYTDTAGAKETLVPPSRPGLVKPISKCALLY